jgi:hypothetical protein
VRQRARRVASPRFTASCSMAVTREAERRARERVPPRTLQTRLASSSRTCFPPVPGLSLRAGYKRFKQ